MISCNAKYIYISIRTHINEFFSLANGGQVSCRLTGSIDITKISPSTTKKRTSGAGGRWQGWRLFWNNVFSERHISREGSTQSKNIQEGMKGKEGDFKYLERHDFLGCKRAEKSKPFLDRLNCYIYPLFSWGYFSVVRVSEWVHSYIISSLEI